MEFAGNAGEVIKKRGFARGVLEPAAVRERLCGSKRDVWSSIGLGRSSPWTLKGEVGRSIGLEIIYMDSSTQLHGLLHWERN